MPVRVILFVPPEPIVKGVAPVNWSVGDEAPIVYADVELPGVIVVIPEAVIVPLV